MNWTGSYLFVAVAALATSVHAVPPEVVDMAAYSTIQAAIDANPARIIRLPAMEYTINRAIVITHDRTEIYGPARIVQTNAHEPMVRIQDAKGVRLVDLSFTRPDGSRETDQAGIDVTGCEEVALLRLRVSENHTHASIHVRKSRDVTVEDCTITNYKGPTIDDRTKLAGAGYAFRSIDGTGIQMLGVHGGVIRNNRVTELRLWPTRQVKDRYNLGALTVVPAMAGPLVSEDIVKSGYTNNWHQGAAIQVSKPDPTDTFIITGNIIDHPAQGLDIHADKVAVAGNMISHCMTGIKTSHGAKNVLIDGNQVDHADLRGVELHAGFTSHASANAAPGVKAMPEDLDGGTLVSNNIFSYFGFGDQYWNWEAHRARNVISITAAPLPTNPPIHDVLVVGNLVYDSGRDTVSLAGKWVKVAPRYHHAVFVEKDRQQPPVNIQEFGNLLDPGLEDVHTQR